MFEFEFEFEFVRDALVSGESEVLILDLREYC